MGGGYLIEEAVWMKKGEKGNRRVEGRRKRTVGTGEDNCSRVTGYRWECEMGFPSGTERKDAVRGGGFTVSRDGEEEKA